MRRRFWKLWYRFKDGGGTGATTKKVPSEPESYIEDRITPHGTVSVVKPGINSRPIPTPSHPTSKYAKRVVRAKPDKAGAECIDEDLAIHVNQQSQ